MQRRAFLASVPAVTPLLAGCLGEDADFEVVNETVTERTVRFSVERASTGEVIVGREVEVPANGEREYEGLITDAPADGIAVRASTPAHDESLVTFEGYTRSYRINVVVDEADITIEAAVP